MTSSSPGSKTSVADRLRELRDVGPRQLIPSAVEDDYAQAWFGLEHSELHSVLEAAPEEAFLRRPLAGFMRALLRGEPTPHLEEDAASTTDCRERAAALTAAILQARLGGQLRVAIALLDQAKEDAPVANALVDASHGSASSLAVQSGITRMLAGDFLGALTEFERAKWTEPPAALAFLVRDAHAKSALIHAVVGDPDLARRELAEAERVPRTASWAEPLVDASAQLASILVEPADAGGRPDQLFSVPRRDVGEAWPYFVLALAPVALGGDPAAEHLLTVLEESQLPGWDSREGLPGSAIPLTRAALACRAGNVGEARDAVDSADPLLCLTSVAAASVALEAGDAPRALALALRVGGETVGLRQLDLWRLSVVFLAHRALAQDTAAAAALRQVKQLAEGMTRFNLAVGGTVGAHIRAVLAGCDAPAPAVMPPSLTPREAAVLRHLTEGLSRRDIAERLFVSANTIKSHVSSLYRKLGVSNRDALLSAAYRRGLL